MLVKRREKAKRVKMEICPRCDGKIVRKGRKNKKYYLCKKCRAKYTLTGELLEEGFQDPVMKESFLKTQKKEQSKKKLIKWCKGKKYYPIKALEFGGEIINLEEYEKTGEKKEIESKKAKKRKKRGKKK